MVSDQVWHYFLLIQQFLDTLPAGSQVDFCNSVVSMIIYRQPLITFAFVMDDWKEILLSTNWKILFLGNIFFLTFYYKRQLVKTEMLSCLSIILELWWINVKKFDKIAW